MLSKTGTETGDVQHGQSSGDVCLKCDHREHASWFEKYGLMASILAGSLIIAGSILYAGQASQPQVAADSSKVLGQQTAPPAAPEEGPVDVKQRSDAPFVGQANAKVVIEEFSDFQCPYCQQFFAESYQQLKAKYVDTGKVKLVFRHLPLPFHQNAQKAAEAAECANRQGKFVPYHDLLFSKAQSDGTGLAIGDLKAYARDLKLDTGKFNTCLDSGETAAIVTQDSTDGASAGVNGTPTFFVNGRRVVGAQPVAVFEQAIERALAE